MPGVNRKSVALLTAGHFFTDLSQGAVPALLPFFVAERDFSYAAAAGIVFAATVASSVVQPLFGGLADRLSSPWLLPAGIFCGGLGLAAAGIFTSYALVFLAVALSGIGVAAFHPEAARRVNLAAGEELGTSMGMFAVGGNAGFAVGPLLTTGLLVFLGLKGTLLLLVPAAAMSVLLVVKLPQHPKHQCTEEQRPTVVCVAARDAWRPFGLLTAIVVCRSIVFFGLATFLPLYWINVLDQSEAAGGTALSVMVAAGAFGPLLGGRLADRHGHRVVILVGMGVLTPLVISLTAVTSSGLATALLVPIGLALFAPFSVMVVMGQEYLPNRPGLASGVTLGLAVSIGGIATPLFGWLADQNGIQAAFTGLAFLPILATGLALTLPYPRKPREIYTES